MILDESLL